VTAHDQASDFLDQIHPDKMTKKRYPVCIPNIGERELELVTETIKTNWISSIGPMVKEFTDKFATFCGTKYAIPCTSGTTALHLAVRGLEIGRNDNALGTSPHEVIAPTFSMIASTNSILFTGAKPVLVDSEMQTWNMNLDHIERSITENTKAIMVVHTYGHPVDMDHVNEIAKKHNLFVIEDAAEAHGAEYKGKRVGGIGDVGCFSFYANKIITTGEGGMCVTNNKELANFIYTLMNHTFTEEKHFWHRHIGYNYRMTSMQAAVGVAQLERADEFIKTKRENARLYNDLLSDIPGITTPPEAKWAKNVYWMYGILTGKEFGVSKDVLRVKLAQEGIETRSFFIPMHHQPVYRKEGLFQDQQFPNSEELEETGFYLPSSTTLKEDDIHFIVDAIKRARV
jgi:perosamine synthetase